MIRIATVALLGAEGALLLVALPLLMFLGGWAGADSGGILYGAAMVAGLPALVRVVSLVGALLGLRRQRNGLAFAAALVPLLAVAGLWLSARS